MVVDVDHRDVDLSVGGEDRVGDADVELVEVLLFEVELTGEEDVAVVTAYVEFVAGVAI